MLSLGSNTVDGCNGVPYPTTPGAKADVGPGYNGTIPSGSFACYSSPNTLGSLCCGQLEGQAYDWCGWAACVVSNRTAWESCIERNGLAANGVSPTQNGGRRRVGGPWRPCRVIVMRVDPPLRCDSGTAGA
ncbi:hypothetical protein CcaverHIS002_0108910 [Cutaneotrichosporon cavernicola]|uniref:Uncharacterized protein n=1 Tax=Cutaneotrichosporon cavernicola TaxID=279322 RepID=A0AA48HZ57_9TREE|nr:uncharacterized protein CcaverHIS019_0108840 [Cutaneotrichosporon cavernicola]BEI80362.1 hypothetical protein CcaverHIS002_0108910 [Cutaneotrichosporon cavernicola]BEI88166.1 hypothetical protein CcaverHIS019_0108840 [Cutaneotrichosporon cavernicola]BEI95937.1 hypothetical protein CcaverHIS631_0108860 [Cutaneotrichosporon cavernicola]BEJ03712.1 hypothetical protein CcaverHIS641_0108870 [Cutaneotrichosporon cavernicola]